MVGQALLGSISPTMMALDVRTTFERTIDLDGYTEIETDEGSDEMDDVLTGFENLLTPALPSHFQRPGIGHARMTTAQRDLVLWRLRSGWLHDQDEAHEGTGSCDDRCRRTGTEGSRGYIRRQPVAPRLGCSDGGAGVGGHGSWYLGDVRTPSVLGLDPADPGFPPVR